MKTAERYLSEDLGLDYPKTPVVSGKWFSDNGLPMIVSCTCCGMTMALPNAYINNEGECFCSSCMELVDD